MPGDSANQTSATHSSVTETAVRWGRSPAYVRRLAQQDQIEGAFKTTSGDWRIPFATPRPFIPEDVVPEASPESQKLLAAAVSAAIRHLDSLQSVQPRTSDSMSQDRADRLEKENARLEKLLAEMTAKVGELQRKIEILKSLI